MDEEDDDQDIRQQSPPDESEYRRMSPHQRAGLFSPFAALTGFDEEISETARLTDQKPELSEDKLTMLDEQLAILKTRLSQSPMVEVLYFRKDHRKSGGAFLTYRGQLRYIDEIGHRLIFRDETVILLEDILELVSVEEEESYDSPVNDR